MHTAVIGSSGCALFIGESVTCCRHQREASSAAAGTPLPSQSGLKSVDWVIGLSGCWAIQRNGVEKQGDDPVCKSTCCSHMPTWLLTPSTYVNCWEWLVPTETEEPLGLPSLAPSSVRYTVPRHESRDGGQHTDYSLNLCVCALDIDVHKNNTHIHHDHTNAEWTDK